MVDVTRATAQRVVEILSAIAAADRPVGVRVLSRALSIDKSSVSRILTQLAAAGYVVRGNEVPRYTIGPRLYALGNAVARKDSLSAASQPILESAVHQTNESCFLAVAEGDVLVIRQRAEGDQPLRYAPKLGERIPFHGGAAGKAFLSGLLDSVLTDMATSAPLEAITARTVTDWTVLLAEVRRDRARGYSVSAEERLPGGAAVAAPYFAPDGRCGGSVVISFPVQRLNHENTLRWGTIVSRAAETLSERLGTIKPLSDS